MTFCEHIITFGAFACMRWRSPEEYLQAGKVISVLGAGQGSSCFATVRSYLELPDAHVLQQSPGRGCVETGEDVCGVSAGVGHDHTAAGVLLHEVRDVINLQPVGAARISFKASNMPCRNSPLPADTPREAHLAPFNQKACLRHALCATPAAERPDERTDTSGRL